MIAALFVETNGCYFSVADVDPWDIRRDARKYDGDYPVVAHPPCERWGRFATWHGGTVGTDDGCFAKALWAVENFKGVIEHPAYSKAWKHYGLDRPRHTGGWLETRYGFTCHVEQGHYGHPARKATWLYYVGEKPPELKWGSAGQRLPSRRLSERGYESARRCGVVANMSSQQRQRTPIEFRDLLLRLVKQGVTG